MERAGGRVILQGHRARTVRGTRCTAGAAAVVGGAQQAAHSLARGVPGIPHHSQSAKPRARAEPKALVPRIADLKPVPLQGGPLKGRGASKDWL